MKNVIAITEVSVEEFNRKIAEIRAKCSFFQLSSSTCLHIDNENSYYSKYSAIIEYEVKHRGLVR